MPRLNTLIEVGFCAGYGDGDYRVSGAIGDLSRERFNELMVTHLWAIKCAQEMWLKAQPQPETGQQARHSALDEALKPFTDEPHKTK